jgi:hypothetical protein
MRRRSTTSTENRENQNWKRMLAWERRVEDSKMAASDEDEYFPPLLKTGKFIQELWWIQELRRRRHRWMEESSDSDDSVTSESASALYEYQMKEAERMDSRSMLRLYHRLYPELVCLAESGLYNIDEVREVLKDFSIHERHICQKILLLFRVVTNGNHVKHT